MNNKRLTITEVADAVGVTPRTIMRWEKAGNSIRMGAFDYLVRPAEDKKILSSIERAVSSVKFAADEPGVKKLIKKDTGYFGLVGRSRSMRDIYNILERISNSRATVLLRGESGTGKRLIAHALHMADSKRKNKSFVEISCGALPREIIESELFGHTKGAFTGAINDRKGRFELADGGTLLLDDIDSMALDLQVKLLRALQQKEFERAGDNKTIKVDVRIIVSTKQDLEKAVEAKKFREDLYCRLNVISINVPPLRERKDDLPEVIFGGASLLNAALGSKVIDAISSLKSAMQEPEKVHILSVLKEVGGIKRRPQINLT